VLTSSESLFSSVYVHWPFCLKECHYCDFHSVSPGGLEARLGSALLLEQKQYEARLLPRLDTVFFGGGTPSLIPPERMPEIFSPLLARVDPATEWTMEMNPSSVSLERMKGYLHIGVNRLSLGVQSLNDNLLQWMGRLHDSRSALQALESAFLAGFSNVSVDVICGVPGQSLADLESTLKQLSVFPITHLSCYLLTLHDGHPLQGELPGEEEQLEHLLFLDRFMTERGFEHYEISNFARAGGANFRARHNMVYWGGGAYLGLGPSAHSFGAGERWWNVSDLDEYCAALESGRSPGGGRERLTQEQQELEKWMLALRLSDGFPDAWLDTPRRRGQVERFQHDGLVEPCPGAPGSWRLTPRGFALSDQVCRALI